MTFVVIVWLLCMFTNVLDNRRGLDRLHSFDSSDRRLLTLALWTNKTQRRKYMNKAKTEIRWANDDGK